MILGSLLVSKRERELDNKTGGEFVWTMVRSLNQHTTGPYT